MGCARITPVPAAGPASSCPDCGGRLEIRRGELTSATGVLPAYAEVPRPREPLPPPDAPPELRKAAKRIRHYHGFTLLVGIYLMLIGLMRISRPSWDGVPALLPSSLFILSGVLALIGHARSPRDSFLHGTSSAIPALLALLLLILQGAILAAGLSHAYLALVLPILGFDAQRTLRRHPVLAEPMGGDPQAPGTWWALSRMTTHEFRQAGLISLVLLLIFVVLTALVVRMVT